MAFSPTCEDYGVRFDETFLSCACLKKKIFDRFKWISIARADHFHVFRSKISPQWLSELRRQWTSVPWQVVCELVVLMPMDSNTMPGQHTQPSPTSFGSKCVCVFNCNMLPELLASWPGSFTCHCGNTGWNGQRTRAGTGRHRELTLDKKIHTPLLPNVDLRPFHHESTALPTELSRLLLVHWWISLRDANIIPKDNR